MAKKARPAGFRRFEQSCFFFVKPKGSLHEGDDNAYSKLISPLSSSVPLCLVWTPRDVKAAWSNIRRTVRYGTVLYGTVCTYRTVCTICTVCLV